MPALEIAFYADIHGCDEIVMATRGLGPIKNLLMGSVAIVVTSLLLLINFLDSPFTDGVGGVDALNAWLAKSGYQMRLLNRGWEYRRKLLARLSIPLERIGLVELNEAFAVQVLACLKELPIDRARLNVNGGAIALGHPLGCSGARLTTTLVHQMRRQGVQYGLVTLCVGGGMGAAALFEAL